MTRAFYQELMRQFCEHAEVADVDAAIRDERLPLKHGNVGVSFSDEQNAIRIEHTVGRIPSAIEEATLQSMLEWNTTSSGQGHCGLRPDGRVVFIRDVQLASFDPPTKPFEVLLQILSVMEEQWVSVMDDALMQFQLVDYRI